MKRSRFEWILALLILPLAFGCAGAQWGTEAGSNADILARTYERQNSESLAMSGWSQLAISQKRAGCEYIIGRPSSLSNPIAESPEVYPRGYMYHYYPDYQVYYCPGESRYYWLDGVVWKSRAQPPDNVNLIAARYASVELDAPAPNAHHAKIERLYPPAYDTAVNPLPAGQASALR